MTISLVTKGIICQKTQIIRADLITAELSSNCVATSSSCVCGLSYKQGNSLDLKFILIDNGVKISSTDLENADDIVFALKLSRYQTDSESAILKLKSMGQVVVLADDTDITVPNILISLSSEDMDIHAGEYYIALCIEFTVTNKKEPTLTQGGCKFNSVSIIKDIVEC